MLRKGHQLRLLRLKLLHHSQVQRRYHLITSIRFQHHLKCQVAEEVAEEVAVGEALAAHPMKD
jgi:hypothetical protein